MSIMAPYKSSNFKRVSFFCLKAFGDLTITLNAISLLDEKIQNDIRCIVGGHHNNLINALMPKCDITFIKLNVNEVPAFYDVRERGLFSAATSFIDAFAKVRKLDFSSDLLLFDKMGLREKLFGLLSNSCSLDHTSNNNIYTQYRATLTRMFDSVSEWPCKQGPGNRILIFPNARKTFRNLNVDIIKAVAESCLLAGFEPVVYVLNNERNINLKGILTIRAPVSFANTIDAISNSRAVISCDSLPMHLSAYIGRPVFVITPYSITKNWLPQFTLENNYWTFFDDLSFKREVLDSFLNRLRFWDSV